MRQRLIQFLQAATMASTLIALPSASDAQTIVMRKVLGGIVKDKVDQARPVGHWIVGDATVTPGCSATQPSSAPVTCVDQAGGALPAAACTGAKPTGLTVAPNYSTCTFQAVTGDWTDWNSSCSDKAQRFRATWCMRSDGTVLDIDQCPGAAPAKTDTAAVTTGCRYEATYGQPTACVPNGAYGTDGGPGTTTAQLSGCFRSDGKNITANPEGHCATTKTDTCMIAPVGRWVVGAAVVTPGCSAAQPTVAPVTCRDSSGKVIEDQYCSSAKPNGTGTVANYDTCTYKDETGDWSNWSSGCSDDAYRVRAVFCRRSDNQLVETSKCPAPIASTIERGGNYSSCTYDGTYKAAGSCVADGPAVLTGKQTAALDTCRRSDGTVVTNGTGISNYCASSKVTTCTLSVTPTFSDTYGTCSGNVQYAPLTKCTRSDGVVVANSFCPSQSPAKACTDAAVPTGNKCEAFAGSRWTGKFINGNTSYRTHSMTANSAAAAQTACETMYKQYGVGACFYSDGSFPVNVSYYEQYAWITFANRPELKGANCGQ